MEAPGGTIMGKHMRGWPSIGVWLFTISDWFDTPNCHVHGIVTSSCGSHFLTLTIYLLLGKQPRVTNWSSGKNWIEIVDEKEVVFVVRDNETFKQAAIFHFMNCSSVNISYGPALSRLNRFLCHGKPMGVSITESSFAHSPCLMNHYFGNAFALGLYAILYKQRTCAQVHTPYYRHIHTYILHGAQILISCIQLILVFAILLILAQF
jgi:hypothetical protein